MDSIGDELIGFKEINNDAIYKTKSGIFYI